MTLRYLVRRRTGEDTLGIFLLTLPANQVAGRSIELTLSSSVEGSRRWISVVPYSDVITGPSAAAAPPELALL